MNILRNMQTVSVSRDGGKTNQYNEKQIEYKFIKKTEMAIYLNAQSNTDDVRYIHAEYVGLSTDKTLTDDMVITTKDNIKYKILLSNMHGRLAQYYLRKFD